MSHSVLELLHERKATRAISSRSIDGGMAEQLMQAAQLSASCFNNQAWRFLVLSEEAALEKGRKAISAGNSWAKTAPLLFIGFSRPDLDCQLTDGRQYYLFDLGMAVQLILLQATELNLVARPFAGFSPETIREEFNLGTEFEIYVMIAVGFEGDISALDERLQAMSRAPRTRNPLSDNFLLNEIAIP